MTFLGRDIGRHVYPFIVAELSGNHGGSLDAALELVGAAKEAGADAVKLQTYEPERMCREDVVAPTPWSGSLRDLYRRAMTPRTWHQRIIEECVKVGIPWFSTPFSVEDVDFLETLDCAAYKVASFELTCAELLDRIAATRKPAVLSTGMASLPEIRSAVDRLSPLVLLRCVSAYPATASAFRLRASLAELRGVGRDAFIGLSDHTTGSVVACVAVALGAVMVEKHLCLPGVPSADDSFSVNPIGLEMFISDVRDAWEATGSGREPFGPHESEHPMMALRRREGLRGE